MEGVFYNVVVNDWGETTFVPTTAGNIILIEAMLLILELAVFIGIKVAEKRKAAGEAAVPAGDAFGENKKSLTKKSGSGLALSAKQLAFCAVAIALGTVLSNVKLFHFPTGGSITLLSMLVICLPGYWFGLGAGVLTGVAYGILQLIIDPYVLFPAQLVVDYILAFGALGLSGLFAKKKYGLIYGYAAGVIGRYVFAVISGWIFFGSYAWEGWSALPYSLAYNAIYIFAEAAITIGILCIPPVRKAMGTIKRFATE